MNKEGKSLMSTTKNTLKTYKQHKIFAAKELLSKCESKANHYLFIILIATVLTIIIIWASLTDIQEIAKTQGEIVPKDKIQLIQHQHGGSIKKLLISEGELVSKGQAIATLDPTALKAELEQNIIKVIALTANKIRLKASINHQELSLEQLIKLTKKEIKFPPSTSLSIKNMLQDSVLLHTLQKSTENNEISALKKRVAQQEVELKSIEEKTAMLKALVDVMEEEKKMYSKLKQRDLASKRELLSATRQYLVLKKDWMESRKQIEKQRRVLEETQAKLRQETHNNDLHSASLLNEINAELLQAKRNIIKIQHQYDNLIIRSPVTGFIKGLSVSPGSVISSNETITEVVPTESELIIESKITSRDIGHVKQGAEVDIKVTAYDYARYGTLQGKLQAISATTFFDETSKQVYYKAFIKINQQGMEEKQFKLMPGMLVEADIRTGKKSIIDYLLKPIYNSLHNSMTER